LKSSKSNQNCLLPVWPLLRRGSFTPVSLRGLAAIRHPWRGAALAASMPLGPLRETCVQPAPKSRLAVFGLLRMKIKSNGNRNGNGNGFPAKAGPTMCALCQRSLIIPTLCVGMHPVTLRVTYPSLNARRLRDAERPGRRYHAERGNDQSESAVTPDRRTGFSREAVDLHLILIFIHSQLRHRQSRLGCRPSADDAQWAERHGCRESAVRTWMSVRRGPTECRRS